MVDELYDCGQSRRRRFTPDEDRILKASVEAQDPKKRNWSEIAHFLEDRTPTQCRDRYTNYLYKEIKNEPWILEEDLIILRNHQKFGNQWNEIAKFLPGRSGNNVKNRWHKYLAIQSNREKIYRKAKSINAKKEREAKSIAVKKLPPIPKPIEQPKIEPPTLPAIFQMDGNGIESSDLNWCYQIDAWLGQAIAK